METLFILLLSPPFPEIIPKIKGVFHIRIGERRAGQPSVAVGFAHKLTRPYQKILKIQYLFAVPCELCVLCG